MLTLNKHAKVSTVTFSPDPQLRGQRSEKVKFLKKLMSNVKTNGANMLALGKHAKLSTVTFLSDLRLRAQKSKKVEFKKYCYRPVSSILHTMIIIAMTMHQLKTRTPSIPWGQKSILGHFGVLKKPAAGSMSSRWHSRMSS